MATAALVSNEVICSVPFLVRRLSVTGGATSADLTHGEAVSPDLVFAQNVTEGAAPSAVGVIRTQSATAVKVDTLVDNAGAIEIYCVWFKQPGSGGLNAP